MVSDWYLVTIEALQNLWQLLLVFIPRVVGAIVVSLIGWFVAVGMGKLVTRILERLKVNRLFEKEAWRRALEKAELKANVSEFFGSIVRWVLIIVFLIPTVEILGLPQFSQFLASVLGFIGNVVVAILMFLVSVVIGDILAKIIVAWAERSGFKSSHFAGEVVKWSIWIFVGLAVLHQLKIAQPLIETLFSGLVGVLVISFGIAFGLGGKEVAAEILQDLKRRLKG